MMSAASITAKSRMDFTNPPLPVVVPKYPETDATISGYFGGTFLIRRHPKWSWR
jgi:hypothetical protein